MSEISERPMTPSRMRKLRMIQSIKSNVVSQPKPKPKPKPKPQSEPIQEIDSGRLSELQKEELRLVNELERVRTEELDEDMPMDEVMSSVTILQEKLAGIRKEIHVEREKKQKQKQLQKKEEIRTQSRAVSPAYSNASIRSYNKKKSTTEDKSCAVSPARSSASSKSYSQKKTTTKPSLGDFKRLETSRFAGKSMSPARKVSPTNSVSNESIDQNSTYSSMSKLADSRLVRQLKQRLSTIELKHQKEIEQLQKTLEEHQGSIYECENVMIEQEEVIEEKEAIISELKENIKNLTQQIKVLEVQLRNGGKKNEYETIDTDTMDQFRELVKDQEKYIEKLESDLNDFKKEDNQEYINQLESELNALKKEGNQEYIDQLEKELNDLKGEKESLESKLSSANANLQKTKDIEKVKSELAILRKEKDTIESKLSISNATCQKLKSNNLELTKKLMDAQNIEKELNVMIGEKQKMIDSMTDEFQSVLSDRYGESFDNPAVREDQSSDRDVSGANGEEVHTGIEELSTICDFFEKCEVKSHFYDVQVKQEIKKFKETISSLRHEVSSHSSELQELRQDLETTKKKYSELEASNKEIMEENASSIRVIQKVMAEMSEEKDMEIQKLRKGIEDLKEEKEELERKAEEMQQKSEENNFAPVELSRQPVSLLSAMRASGISASYSQENFDCENSDADIESDDGSINNTDTLSDSEGIDLSRTFNTDDGSASAAGAIMKRLENELGELKRKLEESEIQNKEYLEEMDSLKHEKENSTNLQNKLEESEAQKEEYTKEIESLKQEYLEKMDSLKHEKENSTSLQNKLDDSEAQKEEYTKEIESLKQNIAKLETKKSEYEVEFESLQAKSMESNKLAIQLEEVENEKKELVNQIDKLKEKELELNSKLQEAEDNKNQYEKEIELYRQKDAEITDINKKLQESETRNENYMIEIESLKQNDVELRTKLEEIEEHKSKYENEISSLKEYKNTLNSKLEEIEKESIDYKNDIDGYIKGENELREKLQESETMRTRYELEMDIMKVKLNDSDSKTKVEEVEARCREELIQEKMLRSKETEDIQQKLQESEEKCKEYENEIELLRQQLLSPKAVHEIKGDDEKVTETKRELDSLEFSTYDLGTTQNTTQQQSKVQDRSFSFTVMGENDCIEEGKEKEEYQDLNTTSDLLGSFDEEEVFDEDEESFTEEIDTLKKDLVVAQHSLENLQTTLDKERGNSQKEKDTLGKMLETKNNALENAKKIIASLQHARTESLMNLKNEVKSKADEIASLQSASDGDKKRLLKLKTEIAVLKQQMSDSNDPTKIQADSTQEEGASENKYQDPLAQVLDQISSALQGSICACMESPSNENLTQEASFRNKSGEIMTPAVLKQAVPLTKQSSGMSTSTRGQRLALETNMDDKTKEFIAKLEKKIENKKKLIRELEEQMDDMDNALDDCHERITDLETEKFTLGEELRGEIEERDHKIIELEKEIASLQQELQDVNLKLKLASTDVCARSTTSSSNDSTASKKENKMRELKKRLSSALREKESVKKELKTYVASLQNAKLIISSLERANKGMMDQYKSRIQSSPSPASPNVKSDSSVTSATSLEKDEELATLRQVMKELREKYENDFSNYQNVLTKLREDAMNSACKVAAQEVEIQLLKKKSRKTLSPTKKPQLRSSGIPDCPSPTKKSRRKNNELEESQTESDNDEELSFVTEDSDSVYDEKELVRKYMEQNNIKAPSTYES